jgi:hypothetical protein
MRWGHDNGVGLMTYGADFLERAVGIYRPNLSGEEASIMPVQQVTKVDLIVNLRPERSA